MFDKLHFRIQLIKTAAEDENNRFVITEMTPRTALLSITSPPGPLEKSMNYLENVSLTGLAGTWLLGKTPLLKTVKSVPKTVSMKNILTTPAGKQATKIMKELGARKSDLLKYIKEYKPAWYEKMRGLKTGPSVFVRSPHKIIEKFVETAGAKQLRLPKHVVKLESALAKRPIKFTTGAGKMLGFGTMALPFLGIGDERIQQAGMAAWALSELPAAYLKAQKNIRASRAAFKAMGGGLKGFKAAFPYARKIFDLPWWGFWAGGSLLALIRALRKKQKEIKIPQPIKNTK